MWSVQDQVVLGMLECFNRVWAREGVTHRLNGGGETPVRAPLYRCVACGTDRGFVEMFQRATPVENVVEKKSRGVRHTVFTFFFYFSFSSPFNSLSMPRKTAGSQAMRSFLPQSLASYPFGRWTCATGTRAIWWCWRPSVASSLQMYTQVQYSACRNIAAAIVGDISC